MGEKKLEKRNIGTARTTRNAVKTIAKRPKNNKNATAFYERWSNYSLALLLIVIWVQDGAPRPPVLSWFINPINYSYIYHKAIEFSHLRQLNYRTGAQSSMAAWVTISNPGTTELGYFFGGIVPCWGYPILAPKCEQKEGLLTSKMVELSSRNMGKLA